MPWHTGTAEIMVRFARCSILIICVVVVASCGKKFNSVSAEKSGASSGILVVKADSNTTKPKSIVTLTGENFSAARALRGRVPLTDATTGDVMLDVASRTTASFTMPEKSALGLQDIGIYQGSTRQIATVTLMVVSQDVNPLPVIIADQATVCSNISYLDSNGVQKTGTKSCDCTASNQQGCVANARYQTVDTQSFTAADIKTGSR